MDFDFNEEQGMLRDVAREFLSAFRSGLNARESFALGLRLFGSASASSQRDCSDSRLIVRPGATLASWTAAVAAVALVSCVCGRSPVAAAGGCDLEVVRERAGLATRPYDAAATVTSPTCPTLS